MTFLYQPLTLNTRTIAGRNGTPAPVVIDDATFIGGTPIDVTYGFDFWRVSWLYDFSRSPETIGLDFEADGFYASSAIFNGSGNPFEGWIWDAAISAKTRVISNATAYVTVRSIGGGAQGSNAYSYRSATTSVNPDTYNALATMAVTLGVSAE